MARLSRRSLNSRTKRLSGQASQHLEKLKEAWSREALARLTDHELLLVYKALKRGAGADLTPEEEEAWRTMREYYEEARSSGCA